jgi:hypothetical protein
MSGGLGSGAMGQACASQMTGGAAGNSGGSAGNATGGAEGGGETQAGGAAGAGGKATILEPYFRAGSRLKPRVLRADGLEILAAGAEQSWYDVLVGESCQFRVGGDGIERCFPSSIISDTDQLGYSDAACTRPATRINLGTASSYLTIEPALGCDFRTYRRGTALPKTTPLYEMRGGACQRLPTPTDSDPSVWPLEEVPPETFVAVTRVSRPRHPDMNALVREGEDGSSEIVGFSDPASAVPCFGIGLDVSPQVCVPGWIQTWDEFGDAACTQRAGVDDAPRCMARTNTVLVDLKGTGDSCTRTRSISGLWQSAGLRQTPIFSNTDGVCESQSSELFAAHVQGAPIDLASLPQLEVIEVGGGPLRVAFYGFGGVPFFPAPLENPLSAGAIFEAATGEPCWPEWFEDKTLRCVPSSFQVTANSNVFYESEGCTGARVSIAPTRCVAGPEPRGLILLDLNQWSVPEGFPVSETLEFGEKFSSTSVFRASDLSSTCQIANVDSSSLLRMNAVNPAELFVPMERKLKD